ncbi:hypothetical protein DPMN_001960 [Dreissena polymorpha]|uniref:Uncharacterized protein n=1 Tax=Dreissena polymorpha TaxID=45954 RepID=A0A9D4MKC5_DREPO|nr:hypothetical protein DPMN_001960 [Dreissena polymorpha]
MGTKHFGYETNLGERGSSTHGDFDTFSETGRRVTFSIKSENHYIWGFPSVKTFEVRPVSCLVPVPNLSIKLKEDGNQAAFTFINDNQRGGAD